MTCIVGCLSNNGNVWLGGDSAGVGGMDLTVRADRKVFRRGPYVIGFTSSFRMGQALAYLGHLPDPTAGEDPMRFMVCDFVEATRKILKDAGYTRIDSNREDGGTFLVGWKGYLFEIGDDFQVVENLAPFAAVGSGSSYALGAMESMPSTTRLADPERFVRDALYVAERWSAGVRGPFHVVSTVDPTDTATRLGA